MLKVNFQIQQGRTLFYCKTQTESIKVTRLQNGEKIPYLWAENHGILVCITNLNLYLVHIVQTLPSVHWPLKNFGIGNQEIKQISIISPNHFAVFFEMYFMDGLANTRDLRSGINNLLLAEKNNPTENLANLQARLLYYSYDEITHREKFDWRDAPEIEKEFKLEFPVEQLLVVFLPEKNVKNRDRDEKVFCILRDVTGSRIVPSRDISLKVKTFIFKTAMQLLNDSKTQSHNPPYLDWTFDIFLPSEPIYFFLELYQKSLLPQSGWKFNTNMSIWLGANWNFMEVNKYHFLILLLNILEGKSPCPTEPEDDKKQFQARARYFMKVLFKTPANIFSCLQIIIEHKVVFLQHGEKLSDSLFLAELFQALSSIRYDDLLDIDTRYYRGVLAKLKVFIEEIYGVEKGEQPGISEALSNLYALYCLGPFYSGPDKKPLKKGMHALIERLELYDRMLQLRLGDFAVLPALLEQLEELELAPMLVDLYNELAVLLRGCEMGKRPLRIELSTDTNGELDCLFFDRETLAGTEEEQLNFSRPQILDQTSNFLYNFYQTTADAVQVSTQDALLRETKYEVLRKKIAHIREELQTAKSNIEKEIMKCTNKNVNASFSEDFYRKKADSGIVLSKGYYLVQAALNEVVFFETREKFPSDSPLRRRILRALRLFSERFHSLDPEIIKLLKKKDAVVEDINKRKDALLTNFTKKKDILLKEAITKKDAFLEGAGKKGKEIAEGFKGKLNSLFPGLFNDDF
ncbi:hypothetical protein ACFL35_09750 [Candidatus Riflebacteria bacterium]